jgi:iron complex outermembrane receptor protein
MPVAAQGVLEEIVVTAQKREQNIQDVGISITAFTGDQMKALGVEKSFDVASFSPGVHISGNLAGQNTQFTIRGVTQNDFNDVIEAPTAVYLDEGYIPIAQAQTFALFDIERVEILKGPQGTLFGRNATGGAVQYLSRKPTLGESDNYLDVTMGEFDSDADASSFNLQGAFGFKITETAAVRFALLHDDVDGYLNNLYPLDAFGAGTFGGPNGNSPGPGAGVDLGGGDTTALRASLLFEPSERLTVNVSLNTAESDMPTGPYQSKATIAVYDGTGPTVAAFPGELINVIDIDPNDARSSICAPGGVDDGTDCGSDQDVSGTPDDFNGDGVPDFGRITNQFQLAPGADFFGYIDPDGDGWNFSGDYAFDDNGFTDTDGINAKVVYEMDNGHTFTSITDWKDYEKLLFIDVDSAPVNQAVNYAGVDASSFTQEFRISGETDDMRWVGGFYYLNIDTDSDNGLKFAPNSLGEDPSLGGPFDLASDAMLETDSYSVFGQVEYDMSDKLTFVGGLRVIKEEKDYFFTQSLYAAPTNARDIHQGFQIIIGPTYPGGVPTAFTDSTSDTLFAGKLHFDYRPNENLLLYAGLNRGIKAGSFNAQLAGGLPIPDSAIPYQEEVLTSLEAGFKHTLANGHTRINGTIFYYDYEDYQAFLFTGVSGVVVNNDADNYGIELDIQSSPMEGLDLLFAASWFDATVKDVPLRVGGPIIRDVDPVYAPEIQASGLVRYEWPISNGKLHVQADFSYSDDYFYNLRNFDADKYDSYTKIGAGFGWTNDADDLSITFNARNLTDERIGIQGFDLATLCGCNEISFQPPRWLGLNVKVSF